MRSESTDMKGPASLCDGYQDNKNHRQQSPMSDRSVDFSEFMWMGEELEEFDRKVHQELMEQEFIDSCFEQMLAEEGQEQPQQEPWFLPEQQRLTPTDLVHSQMANQMQQLSLDHANYAYGQQLGHINHVNMQTQFQRPAVPPVQVMTSKLNPHAPEFVPRSSGADR